jgi:predicted acetyltransferase
VNVTDQQRPEWKVTGTDREGFAAVAPVLHESLLFPGDCASFLERVRPLADAQGYERVLVAWDGDRAVGTTNAFPFEMTLPGGPRPVAGVSAVGVWPTYRRQGVLSALMRRQLADIRDRGEKVAALWASEGVIYGRFGYGAASVQHKVSVRQPHNRLASDAPRDPLLTTVLAPALEVRADVERVHRVVAPTRPGDYQRDESWWNRLLRDSPKLRGDSAELKAAVVRDGDTPVGYALYFSRRVRAADGGVRGELDVWEVAATTPAARVAVYEHVFSRDLVTRVEFAHLPVDDPIWSLIADPQCLEVSPRVALWIRLVDLPGALAERSYAAPVDVVIEVADRYAPWNEGRWRLRADRSGATCEPTSDAPDLTLDAAHLGAAFLGQSTLGAKVLAGTVTEHTPGAADLLDTALRVPRAPLCGVIF